MIAERESMEAKLLMMLETLAEFADTHNMQAILLQTYIQRFGPLSEQAGAKVRAILQETPK